MVLQGGGQTQYKVCAPVFFASGGDRGSVDVISSFSGHPQAAAVDMPGSTVDMPRRRRWTCPGGGGGHARQRLWTSPRILPPTPAAASMTTTHATDLLCLAPVCLLSPFTTFAYLFCSLALPILPPDFPCEIINLIVAINTLDCYIHIARLEHTRSTGGWNWPLDGLHPPNFYQKSLAFSSLFRLIEKHS